MDRARALASIVLPTPGTSSMSKWPSASSAMIATLTASAVTSMTDSTAVPIWCAVATRSSSARCCPRPVSSTKKPSWKRPGWSALPLATGDSVVVYRQYVVPLQKCHARSGDGHFSVLADGSARAPTRHAAPRTPGGNGAHGASVRDARSGAFLPPLRPTGAELGICGADGAVEEVWAGAGGGMWSTVGRGGVRWLSKLGSLGGWR